MTRYKVVGPHEVDGTAPGDTFSITDETRARQLVRAGHIERVAEPKKPTKKRGA